MAGPLSDYVSAIPPERIIPDMLESFVDAKWKYKKVVEQITEFQSQLNDETEVSVNLACFGSSISMVVTRISYQNPDILYFYGYVNGSYAQLIQHMNQLNFLMCAVPKFNPDEPARRIGFTENWDN